MSHILEIKDLQVQYHTEDGTVYALNHVDLELDDGETLGLVGETGAGKTTLAKSIMRLIPDPPGKIEGGVIEFEGRDLLKASGAEIRAVRGNQISMIFQDPMSSLNPVVRVGEQIAEVIRVHEKCTKKEAEEKAMEMLETVGIPAERAGDFPHQFSGGMKQRVVIAQVLEMMRRLKDKYHTATLLITHDLGVVAQMCEKVAIIYAGEVVESGAVLDIYKHTLHPYTEGLLGAIPQVHLHVHRLSPIDGLMPDPTAQRTGCPFADRCKYAFERCRVEHPRFIDAGNGHRVRCFKVENELRKGAGE